MPLSQAADEDAPTEVHRDVSSGGVRLRATEWCSTDNSSCEHTVIALPGILAPRYSFAPLAKEMVPDFRLIAVDFPGFGESEKPTPARYPYGVEAFAEGIADLFGGLNLSRAHVLGHGLGGAVAVTLAARHPELVRRLALLAPLAHPPRLPSLNRALLAPVVGGLIFRQFFGKSSFFRLYRERVHPGATPLQLNDYYESLSSPACRAALLATLRASLDGHGVIADSRRVRAPTLILWGSEDRLLPVEHGRYLSREMPEAGLSILPCSHAPHEELPADTAATLSKFFLGKRAGLERVS